MVKNVQAYYLIPGTLARVIQDDHVNGMAERIFQRLHAEHGYTGGKAETAGVAKALLTVLPGFGSEWKDRNEETSR